MRVPGLPPAMVMPPSHGGVPLPKILRRSRWIAWLLLGPPRSKTARLVAPVIVKPRRVMNFDCWNRKASPLVHWAAGGVTTTLSRGAPGSAWITIRSASLAPVVLFLPVIAICS